MFNKLEKMKHYLLINSQLSLSRKNSSRVYLEYNSGNRLFDSQETENIFQLPHKENL